MIVVSALNGQQIKGVITDEFGNPLPAVNVFLKNTTTGSTSGVDGRFRFEVKQGAHTVVFRILGYEIIEQDISVTSSKTVDMNIVLREKSVDLNEAVVYADRRDIAVKVMRGAREKRKYYHDALKSYSCVVYRKTSLEKEYLPSLQPDTVFDEVSVEVLDILQPDTVVQTRTTVLREYHSRIEASGNLFRETILGENEHKAKRPTNSISITFGIESKGLNITSLGREYRDPYIIFHDASSARFDFLRPFIIVPDLCEKPLLSPLAPLAPFSYVFDFDGVLYENNRKVFKIRVTPLFPGDALFSGHVFIEDSTWALKSVDLSVNPRVLLFCSEFRIKQDYLQINDSVLVPEKTEFFYTIKDGKDLITGKTGLYYSQYEVNMRFQSGTFSGQSMIFDPRALNRDSLWWINSRSVPLTDHELHFALKNDSLQRKYESREYNDSLDSAYNDINIWSFLIRGIGIRSSIRKSEIYILPLIAQVNPVGIGGYRHRLGGAYSKRFQNDMLLETEGMIDYGFSNKDVRGRVGTGLTYVPQKFVRTFIRFGDYYDMINDYASIGSVFSRSNYVRTQTFSVAQRMEIVNGLFGEVTLSYSDQTPIRDMKLESWSNQLFGELNNPADFERYKKFEIMLEMKFRPYQKYVMKGNRKIILETNKPEFSLVYRKGIPKLLGSEVNYDFLELGVRDAMKLARWGTSNWAVLAGSFLNRRSLRLIEHRYFRGSDLFFFSDPIRSFQLLDATLSSSSAYFRANYMHHFEGALTNKIPVFNRLKISLAGGAGILMMEENNFRHAEMFAGIERVFRIRKQLFRVGVFGVTADDNLSKARITYKVGINMYNPYTGKWDY
jgi:hypothetical protein